MAWNLRPEKNMTKQPDSDEEAKLLSNCAKSFHEMNCWIDNNKNATDFTEYEELQKQHLKNMDALYEFWQKCEDDGTSVHQVGKCDLDDHVVPSIYA